MFHLITCNCHISTVLIYLWSFERCVRIACHQHQYKEREKGGQNMYICITFKLHAIRKKRQTKVGRHVFGMNRISIISDVYQMKIS